VPQGKVTDALVDFTDMLPTFAELAGVSLQGRDTIDGHSFAPLILGRAGDSPRQWIMAMGSHPAVIRNGRVENFFPFRDRVIRDKRYKVFVDTTRKISGLYDLGSDPQEKNNLISVENSGFGEILEKYDEIINLLPVQDANPKYKKLDKTYYDIPVDELYKLSVKLNRLPNKAPMPR
jgi:hypothetical protein